LADESIGLVIGNCVLLNADTVSALQVQSRLDNRKGLVRLVRLHPHGVPRLNDVVIALDRQLLQAIQVNPSDLARISLRAEIYVTQTLLSLG
jgi:hypothetical protein